MTNGKYVATGQDTQDGWEDEGEISGAMKRMLVFISPNFCLFLRNDSSFRIMFGAD
jgi:hypothetical protein